MRFKELTGQVTAIKIKVRLSKDGVADAIVEIPILEVTLYAEIKLNVTNQTFGAIVHQLKVINAVERNILITRYITLQLADRLKELDIQFLDTAGNAYINLPNMFLFIKGNKAKEDFVKEKTIRAFLPAGLQLIYALLCNPGLENKPFRMMANISNIANGAVTWAIKDLKKLGYLVDIGENSR